VEWSAIGLGDGDAIYRIVRSAAGRGADTNPAFVHRAQAVLGKVPRQALADTLVRIERSEPELLRALTAGMT
jgi:putative chitinase